LQFLLPCVLAASLMGCQGEASKKETPAVQPGQEAVRADTARQGREAKITLENPVIDLGEVGTSKRLSGKFTFVSSGKARLKIVKVHSCCGVTVRGVADGQEYKPRKRGVLEFTWDTPSSPESPAVKEVRMKTNDPDQKFVSLKIKASVVQRAEASPERLRLFLRQENAACSDITVRSLDGKPFAITAFKSTGDCVSAQFDSNARATELVLKPKVNLEKLRATPRGLVSIDLTHPECGNVRVFYDVLPEFTITPAQIMLLSVRPEQPIRQDVWVLGNYSNEFEIESVSSQKGYIKLIERKKVGERHQLTIEITPPARAGSRAVATPSGDGQNAAAQQAAASALVSDVLEVKITDGETLSVPFRGFYAAE